MQDYDIDDAAASRVTGHLLITDGDTGEVLLNKRNAVNYENFSVAIGRSLANRPEGNIHEMHFGSGGSTVNGTGAITYFPPNVSGSAANLYNPSYFKVVNDLSPLNVDPSKNFIEVNHLNNTFYTDIVITCTLDYSEPAGQNAFDDDTDLEGDFVFDEIGLKTYDPVAGNGLLITHLVFNPLMKSINRLIEVVYTLRISMN
jgi:hypothetical protein